MDFCFGLRHEVIQIILVRMWKDDNIPPHPTYTTPCQMRMLMNMSANHCDWLNVIILCACHWSSPFWCACEYPTPPHPRCACWWILSVVTSFPRSWLIVRCVSAQVSEIYVTQCASEWNFQCASGCLSYSIYVYLSLINLSVFLSYFSYRSYSSYLSYLSRIDLESRIYLE